MNSEPFTDSFCVCVMFLFWNECAVQKQFKLIKIVLNEAEDF